LQVIRDVEILKSTNWRRKHVRSIQQWYANAPYLDDYLPTIKQIYAEDHDRLVTLNLEFTRFLWDALGLKTELILQTEIGVTGRGTDLIVRICERLSAKRYLTFPMAAKYLHSTELMQAGIQLKIVPFYPPVYPQLWGDFIPNLSALDLVLNCGVMSSDILSKT
jgi:hypothetical protein